MISGILRLDFRYEIKVSQYLIYNLKRDLNWNLNYSRSNEWFDLKKYICFEVKPSLRLRQCFEINWLEI